jgi:crotonobetainyl-CoA:carnitine CoA-transferase CaiB-like acyl-CoA transferase
VPPRKFGSTPGPKAFASPGFGQHAAEILAAHGYGEEEIARLRALEVLPGRMG